MFQWLKGEFSRVFPVFLFFFVTFNLLNFTEGLMFEKEGIHSVSWGVVLISSLVIAKVFLIVDYLPITNLFSHKPLIYTTTWKTFLYGLASFFFR